METGFYDLSANALISSVAPLPDVQQFSEESHYKGLCNVSESELFTAYTFKDNHSPGLVIRGASPYKRSCHTQKQG